MNTESLYGDDYGRELRVEATHLTPASKRDICWTLAVLVLLVDSEVVFLLAVFFVASLPVSIALIALQVVAVPAAIYLASNFPK